MNNARVTGKNLIVKSSVILDLTQLTPVEDALVLAQDYLHNFAIEPDFGQKMVVAFGQEAEFDSLKTAWLAGDFSDFPEIEVRNAADINGANGAFATATNRIYLSQEFINSNQQDVGAIARVLLEEFGHFVDSQLNEVDSPGDEGAIFAALTRGESLNNQQLQVLRAEDDTAILTLDNQTIIQIEMNTDNFGQWKIERTGVNLPPGQILSLNSIEFYSSENYAFIPAAKITSPNGSSSIVYYEPFYFPYTSKIDNFLSREYFFQTTSSGVKVNFVSKYWKYGYNNPPSTGNEIWTLVSYINLIPQANGLYTKEVFDARSIEGNNVSVNQNYDGTFTMFESGGSFGSPIGSDPNYYLQSTQQGLDLDLFVGDNNQVSADLETILVDLWKPNFGSLQYLMAPQYGGYYPSLAVGSVIFLDITSNENLIGIGSDHQATYNINLNNNQTEDITDSQLEITIPKGVNIVSTSLSITSSKQDTQGNTILTVNPGTISGKSTLTKAITLEATGFSQPLDKLQDYLWNIDVKGSATANISGTNVESNTASISTVIDSSRGLAENLVRRFSVDSDQIIDTGAEDIQKVIFQFFFEKPVQTYKDYGSRQIQDLLKFDPNKVISAIQPYTKKIEQNFNQGILQIPNQFQNIDVAAFRKSTGLLLEAGANNLFPGVFEALRSSGLSYDNGFTRYTKIVGNETFDFDLYTGKLEDVPTAILQSALNNNTNSVQSWVNSTVNNFTAQASYARTLPNSQVNATAILILKKIRENSVI